MGSRQNFLRPSPLRNLISGEPSRLQFPVTPPLGIKFLRYPYGTFQPPAGHLLQGDFLNGPIVNFGWEKWISQKQLLLNDSYV